MSDIACCGRLLRLVPFWSFAIMASLLAGESRAEVRKETYTYKKVGDLEIKADVYRPEGDGPRPVVVWIHGGALIMGHREQVSNLKDDFLKAGFLVVSIDYRLAPETKMPDIVQDVEDSFHWIRTQGPKLFHADPDRIAVWGGSAGGYLTLTAGYRVKPRLKALVAFWGYGDVIGPWYSEPSPHERHQKIKVSREEAFKVVSGPAISDARNRKGDGGVFYQHCRQHGIWPKSVTAGWDPKTEAEKFYPFMPLKNVSADYPPTLLIHGDKDTDVPYEQSVLMNAELERKGVEHKFIGIPNGEHGLQGADPKAIEEANRAAVEFIKQHLK